MLTLIYMVHMCDVAGLNWDGALRKKATIHQVTTMLATSKNVLFPGHYHLTNHWYWWPFTRWHPSNNQSVRSSIPVVSRWLWPGSRIYLEVVSMVVTRWIVAFSYSGDMTIKAVFTFTSFSECVVVSLSVIMHMFIKQQSAQSLEKSMFFTSGCLNVLQENVYFGLVWMYLWFSGLGLGRQPLRPAWHRQHTIYRRSCPPGDVIPCNSREDLCRTVPQPGTHWQSTVSYLNVSIIEESQYELRCE